MEENALPRQPAPLKQQRAYPNLRGPIFIRVANIHLTVFYLRLKMLNSKLYRRGTIKRREPYQVVLLYHGDDQHLQRLVRNIPRSEHLGQTNSYWCRFLGEVCDSEREGFTRRHHRARGVHTHPGESGEVVNVHYRGDLWAGADIGDLDFVPNLTGEDLAVEDENIRTYLVQHGWVGEMSEEDLKALAEHGITPALAQEAEKLGGTWQWRI